VDHRALINLPARFHFDNYTYIYTYIHIVWQLLTTKLHDETALISDLTGSAVCSHLAPWRQRHPLIEVGCDDSKPLRALTELTDTMINRPDHTSGILTNGGSRRRGTGRGPRLLRLYGCKLLNRTTSLPALGQEAQFV
jgi:hypothetical protein